MDMILSMVTSLWWFSNGKLCSLLQGDMEYILTDKIHNGLERESVQLFTNILLHL